MTLAATAHRVRPGRSLCGLRHSLHAEASVAAELVRADAAITGLQYVPALLALHSARKHLRAWLCVLGLDDGAAPPTPTRDTRRLPRRAHPPVYVALRRVHAALSSKFTLYFHECLGRPRVSSEVRVAPGSIVVDYFFRQVCAFLHRTGAVHVALVLSRGAAGEGESYAADGYVPPESDPPAPYTGLQKFPVLFAYPEALPPRHHIAVVTLVTDPRRSVRLDGMDVVRYDEAASGGPDACSYYLARVDPPVTLVLAYGASAARRGAGAKDRFHTGVISFVRDFCREMRRVWQLLRADRLPFV